MRKTNRQEVLEFMKGNGGKATPDQLIRAIYTSRGRPHNASINSTLRIMEGREIIKVKPGLYELRLPWKLENKQLTKRERREVRLANPEAFVKILDNLPNSVYEMVLEEMKYGA